MNLPRPVLVRYVNDTEVHVMGVQPMEDAYGIRDDGIFEHVGHVQRVSVLTDYGLTATRWEAHALAGDRRVRAKTRRHATARMLELLGYFPIRSIETIPRLF